MEWVSVEDRLPEMINDNHSDDVLTYCISDGKSRDLPNTFEKDEKFISIDRLVKWRDTKEISFRTDRFYGKCSHWMKLPEPPEE